MASTIKKKTNKKTARNMVLDAEPRDFQALGTLAQVEACPPGKVPVCLYAVREHQFPMTSEQFDHVTRCDNDVFSDTDEDDCSLQTNLEHSLSVCETTLVYGVAVFLEADNVAGSIQGASVVAPAAPNTPQPTIVGAVNVCGGYCGGVFGVPTDTDVIGPAGLDYGGIGMDFIEQYSRLYDVEFSVCRSMIMQEQMRNVGYACSQSMTAGMGHASIPTACIVRALNDRLSDMGENTRFLQANSAFIDAGGATTTAACAPAQLMDVMRGAAHVGGMKRGFWPFPKPIVICPGQPIKLNFVRNADPACLPALKCRSTISRTTPDANYLSSLEGQTTSVCRDYTTYPLGTIRIGAALCGVALYPQVCYEYAAKYCHEGDPSLFIAGTQQHLAGLMQRFGDPTGRIRKMLGSKPTFRDRLAQSQEVSGLTPVR